MSVSLNMQLEGIEELQKELDYIKSHAVKVGVLGKNGAGEMKNEIALIQEYAIYNEYGTISRPFFRLSVATSKAQKEIMDFMSGEIEKVVNGEMTGLQYYESIGTFVVKRIKDKIRTYGFKPNHSYTIKKKNSSKPLMDTHSLYNSISYEIVGV